MKLCDICWKWKPEETVRFSRKTEIEACDQCVANIGRKVVWIIAFVLAALFWLGFKAIQQ